MPRRTANDRIRTRHYIREWRKLRKMSQEQLAARIGSSTANLSRLENGKQDYTQKVIETIAEALGTDPASLITRDPSRPEAIWTIWDSASPGQRSQIIEVAKALIKTS